MWKDISTKEKAAFMKIALKNGISDLEQIRNTYDEISVNTYGEGGEVNVPLAPKESEVTNLYKPNWAKLMEEREAALEFTPTFISEVPKEENIEESSSKEYKVLDRDQDRWLISRANKLQTSGMAREATMDYLKSLDKEELKEVQKKIADSGGFDESLEGLSRSRIKRIQTTLVKRGFLKPGEGKSVSSEIDGIAGKKTKAAYERYNRERNVDGLLGKRTIKGYMKMQNIDDPWGRECSTSNIDGCAQWVTKKYETAMGNMSKQDGVFSNAWQMPQLVVDKGGSFIYNIYDDDRFKGINDTSTLKIRTAQALKENPIDYSQLQPGDIVGIYLPSSNMHKVALKDGTTKNTHVGIVTGFDADGMPIVEHNIHTSHRVDRADKLSGSLYGRAQIATVARPKQRASNLKELTYVNKQSRYTIDEKYNNPELQEYTNSMEGARDQIGYLYPKANMDDVQQIAIGVLKRETGFMKNKVSDQGVGRQVKEGVKNVVRFFKGLDDDTKSSNLTKFKLSTLNYNERKLLGIHSKEDLENPTKAGLASEFILAKNYDYFQRLAEKYPELGITQKDIQALTALSYNQGMGRLYHIGFDPKTGKIKKEELEAIRKMMNPDYKVKDVTSTNLRFLGDFGKWIYERTSDGYQSYIASTMEAMDKYINKR